ncbi:hypothetical protein V2I01_33955 [Micromonospora sp. BRA006-A]|nr:hypothetical protein [Micromonospora sp. BRA006-A]
MTELERVRGPSATAASRNRGGCPSRPSWPSRTRTCPTRSGRRGGCATWPVRVVPPPAAAARVEGLLAGEPDLDEVSRRRWPGAIPPSSRWNGPGRCSATGSGCAGHGAAGTRGSSCTPRCGCSRRLARRAGRGGAAPRSTPPAGGRPNPATGPSTG